MVFITYTSSFSDGFHYINDAVFLIVFFFCLESSLGAVTCK